MLEIGVCSESNTPPYVSNPLSVVDTGKKRLVLDVSRTINPISLYKKVDLGSLHSYNENVSKGDYMAILDIKNAYYHYKVAREQKPFFGFTWKFENGKEFHNQSHEAHFSKTICKFPSVFQKGCMGSTRLLENKK